MAANFAGKTYIVTGGASGIGLAVVKKLLELSAIVHVIDLSSKGPSIDGDNVAERFIFHPNVDVSSRQSVSTAFKAIIQRSPDIDGIVNNAGIFMHMSPEEGLIESDDAFSKVMSVNVGGIWNTGTEYLQYVLNRYPESRKKITRPVPEGLGNIVNTASVCSFVAEPGIAAYTTSKHAILGLTRAWAQDFTGRGVRVNCVAPGGVETPFTAQMDNEVLEQGYAGRIGMRRFARAEEVANVVVFLLSEQASYVSGQMYPVLGGPY